MSKRPRRNHAPAFKAKVALDALTGDQTIVELAQLIENYQSKTSQKKRGYRSLEKDPLILVVSCGVYFTWAIGLNN